MSGLLLDGKPRDSRRRRGRRGGRTPAPSTPRGRAEPSLRSSEVTHPDARLSQRCRQRRNFHQTNQNYLLLIECCQSTHARTGEIKEGRKTGTREVPERAAVLGREPGSTPRGQRRDGTLTPGTPLGRVESRQNQGRRVRPVGAGRALHREGKPQGLREAPAGTLRSLLCHLLCHLHKAERPGSWLNLDALDNRAANRVRSTGGSESLPRPRSARLLLHGAADAVHGSSDCDCLHRKHEGRQSRCWPM